MLGENDLAKSFKSYQIFGIRKPMNNDVFSYFKNMVKSEAFC